MKTDFKIAWVDDNFSDQQMQSSKDLLTRQLIRKNGFSLIADDIFKASVEENFEDILNGIVKVVDSSNSIDLALIDYELSKITNKSGKQLNGQDIAKQFRDALPSVDIIFYSGKKSAEELRLVLAKANVDCVNCVGRDRLVEGTYTVIENVINRSCKISTLRGLVLNSVCEMDNMIVDILGKYADRGANQQKEIKDKAAILIDRNAKASRLTTLKKQTVEELLLNKNMMSGKLFSILYDIKTKLGLSSPQLKLLDKYRNEIMELRTPAAHARETVCPRTDQAMLKFKLVEYKRGDIDDICKTIVKHENNIQEILDVIV